MFFQDRDVGLLVSKRRYEVVIKVCARARARARARGPGEGREQDDIQQDPSVEMTGVLSAEAVNLHHLWLRPFKLGQT